MKRTLPYLVAAAGAVAVIIFVVTLVGALWYSPQNEIAAPFAATVPSDPPTRLIIPAINLNVHVQQAGLIAGNRMAAPTNFTDVAWYKYGPAPGMLGSAVIAGHLDNGLGLTGVFKNLKELKVGDDIQVLTATGTTLHFTVEKLVAYPYDQVPASIFTDNDKARLNLITCAGKWIKTPALGWTIDHRLIVYATLNS